MTASDPLVNPAHLARRSVAVLALEHDYLERMGQPCDLPHIDPERVPNLRVTNLCQSGQHVRCWAAFDVPGRNALAGCSCLCHRAYMADYWDALTAEADQAGELPADQELDQLADSLDPSAYLAELDADQEPGPAGYREAIRDGRTDDRIDQEPGAWPSRVVAECGTCGGSIDLSGDLVCGECGRSFGPSRSPAVLAAPPADPAIPAGWDRLRRQGLSDLQLRAMDGDR